MYAYYNWMTNYGLLLISIQNCTKILTKSNSWSPEPLPFFSVILTVSYRLSGPDIPGFLLQPFRKPKRIRTAFSPSQLLKLEHAFEKNHYVVGAERKQLAQSLSLTETQVGFIYISINNCKTLSRFSWTRKNILILTSFLLSKVYYMLLMHNHI